MVVTPLEATITGSLFSILILTIGYFLKRTFENQDRQVKEQSKINAELMKSFDNLNTTMASICEGFKWMKEGCAERHVIVNGRLGKLENLNKLKVS